MATTKKRHQWAHHLQSEIHTLNGDLLQVLLCCQYYVSVLCSPSDILRNFDRLHCSALIQEGATAQSAKAVALDTLTRCCGRLGLPPLSSSTLSSGSSGRLSVSLWQCDHANRVTAAAIKGSRQLKVSNFRHSPEFGGRTGHTVYYAIV